MSDRLLRPAEAAKLLALTVRALDHRRLDGEIAAVRDGRLVKYRLSTVLAYMDRNEVLLPPRRRRMPKVVPMRCSSERGPK